MQDSNVAHSVPPAPIAAAGDAEHKLANWAAVGDLPGPAGAAEVPAATQPAASSAGPASPLSSTLLGHPEVDGSAAEGPAAAPLAAGELVAAPSAAAGPGEVDTVAGRMAAALSDAGSEGGLSDVATEMSDVEESPSEPVGVFAGSAESDASALHLPPPPPPQQQGVRQAAGLAELGGPLQQASPKADLSAVPTPDVQLAAEERPGGSLKEGEAAQLESAGGEREAAGQGAQQLERAVQPLLPQGPQQVQQGKQQPPTLLEVAEEMERRLGSGRCRGHLIYSSGATDVSSSVPHLVHRL